MRPPPFVLLHPSGHPRGPRLTLPNYPGWRLVTFRDVPFGTCCLEVVRLSHLVAGDLYFLRLNNEYRFLFRPLGHVHCYLGPSVALADVMIRGSGSYVMAAKKKFVPPALKTREAANPAPDCLDGHFGESFPQLWGYLSCHLDATGVKRETSTLNVFASPEGGFKGYLHDRAEGQKLWAVADTFMGICERLETDLADAMAVWREDWQGKTGRRK